MTVCSENVGKWPPRPPLVTPMQVTPTLPATMPQP